MPKFIKYPHISNFNKFIYDNRDKLANHSTLTFAATNKLHGTNAAIVIDPVNKDYHFQSRNHIINELSDNAGTVALLKPFIEDIIQLSLQHFPFAKHQICLFGEICGRGVQPIVGISQLPKFFALFGVLVDDIWQDSNIWKDFCLTEHRFYNIQHFPCYEIADVNILEDTKAINDKMMEYTLQVEKNCPVTVILGGNEGGIGEGLVWHASGVTTDGKKEHFCLKTKGTKHEGQRKDPNAIRNSVKKQPEAVSPAVQDFITAVFTQSRIDQAKSYLTEMNLPINKLSAGTFVKWISDDILREHGYYLEEHGLDWKKDNIGKIIGKLALTELL